MSDSQLFTLAVIILVITGGGYSLYALYALWKAWASEEWLPVDCTIRSSILEGKNTGRGQYHRPVITFEYRVEGKDYISKRARIADKIGMLSREKAEVIHRRYCAGQTTTAYYNPTKPAEAVLIKGSHGGIYMLLAFGCISLVGAIVFSVIAV